MYDPNVRGLAWDFSGDIATGDQGQLVTLQGFDHWARQFLLELNLRPGDWDLHPEMGINIVGPRGQFNTEENRRVLQKDLERQITERGLAGAFSVRVMVTSSERNTITVTFTLLSHAETTRLAYRLIEDGSVTVLDDTTTPHPEPESPTPEIPNKFLRRRLT